jgi:hypothetical protein
MMERVATKVRHDLLITLAHAHHIYLLITLPVQKYHQSSPLARLPRMTCV